MTTIYVPTLIESAEQAEKLPVGTLARHASGPGMDHAHKVSPIGIDVWVAVGGNSTNASMVGWTALVPVEAEEEHDTDCVDVPGGRPIRRLVTPWEEA